ncbi:MAG: transglutaminase-like cysteine peptidase [Gammaproteobacteria bacterium]
MDFNLIRTPLIACLALSLLFVSPAKSFAVNEIFGYSQKQYDSSRKLFPKWFGMTDRARDDDSKLSDCKPDFFNACFQNELTKIMPKLRKLPKLHQVKAINAFVNKMKYVSDTSTWGIKDYWAARWEFYGKNQGDCEDYAIAKYYTLKELGFPIASLRVVAVRDSNLNLGHAILMVELDGTSWVLDNRVKTIQRQDKVVHYIPVYSINEEHWWRHRPKKP